MLSSSHFNIILTLNEGRGKKNTLEQFVMHPSPELVYWQVMICLSL